MKLHDSFGMNPRTVRFFLLEKGINVPTEKVDILSADNRKEAYLAVNPSGQTPALTLDSGLTVSEVPAICELLEDMHPQPSLIGTTSEERAETRMWWRRVEIGICHPMVQGFYFAEGLDLFKTRFRCVPEAADGLKARARDQMMWLDAQLDGKEWLCGHRFTAADIALFCYMDQLEDANQPAPENAKNLLAWKARVGSRPAAEASIWEERPMGMRG
ncbi:MAG: glutathione S-transferase family protein [Pseudomonadota bacterium]